MKKAAIDIGTVTVRLLVADVEQGEVREAFRRQAIVHLGEGLTETGELSETAIERTVAVAAGFAREAREAGAERVVAAGTSACRDAANTNELLARLDSAGVRTVILSGGREGYLSFLGATYGMEGKDILVDDVGGGSTELVLGTSEREDGRRRVDIEASRSFDVGSRRLTEMFLGGDPPTEAEMDAAAEHVAEELAPFFNGLARPSVVVSVAGTATSLAAVKERMQVYDSARVHGYRLSGAEVAGLKEDLASMTLEARRRLPGLEPERAGVIVAGSLILETLLGLAGVDSTLVSEHDNLYGLVLEGAQAP